MLWGGKIKTWHSRKGLLCPQHLNIDKSRLKQTSRENLKEKEVIKGQSGECKELGRGIPNIAWKMVKCAHMHERAREKMTEEWIDTLYGSAYRWPVPISIYSLLPQEQNLKFCRHFATQVRLQLCASPASRCGLISRLLQKASIKLS